jgi:hypothetical protein
MQPTHATLPGAASQWQAKFVRHRMGYAGLAPIPEGSGPIPPATSQTGFATNPIACVQRLLAISKTTVLDRPAFWQGIAPTLPPGHENPLYYPTSFQSIVFSMAFLLRPLLVVIEGYPALFDINNYTSLTYFIIALWSYTFATKVKHPQSDNSAWPQWRNADRPGRIQQHQATKQHDRHRERSGSARRPPQGRSAADGQGAGQLTIRTEVSARNRPRPDSAPGNRAVRPAAAIRISTSTTARATAADGRGAGQLTIRTVASARDRPGQTQHQVIKQPDQQQRSGSVHRPPSGRRQRTDVTLAS